MGDLLRRRVLTAESDAVQVDWKYEWDYTSGTYPPSMTYVKNDGNGVFDDYVQLYVPVLNTGLSGDGEMEIVACISHAVANWPRFVGKDANGVGAIMIPSSGGLKCQTSHYNTFAPDGTAGGSTFEDGKFHTYRIILRNGIVRLSLDGKVLIQNRAMAAVWDDQPWGIRSGGTAWGARPLVRFKSIKIGLYT